MTGKTRELGRKDEEDGWQGQDIQNRAGMTRETGQGGQNKMDRTEWTEQDGQDIIYMACRTGRIGQLERMLNRT